MIRRRFRKECVDASPRVESGMRSPVFFYIIPAGGRAVQLLIHRFVYPYEDQVANTSGPYAPVRIGDELASMLWLPTISR